MIQFFPSRAIALAIGGFSIHWYGIMYLLAFIIAAVLLPLLQRYRDLKMTGDEWLSLLSWGIVGVIAGGRLGYVFFYEPQYFFAHPLEIFAVWNGGMSFHGGLIGVSLLVLLYCRKRGLNILRIADTIIVPVCIGLALGRFGNFINQELYGTVTTLPWGISIPGVEGLRHPTQLYSMSEDLLTGLICFLYMRYTFKRRSLKSVIYGRTAALFLILYGVFRFTVEYVRAQQYPLTVLGPVVLTRGQLLTVPVFIAGVVLWFWLKRMPLARAQGPA